MLADWFSNGIYPVGMLPLAHAGHWVVWFLYLPPLLIVIASIVSSKLAERRRR
jgi:hypothetical protein